MSNDMMCVLSVSLYPLVHSEIIPIFSSKNEKCKPYAAMNSWTAGCDGCFLFFLCQRVVIGGAARVRLKVKVGGEEVADNGKRISFYRQVLSQRVPRKE